MKMVKFFHKFMGKMVKAGARASQKFSGSATLIALIRMQSGEF
jgi:hypothetical protein